MAPGGAVVDSSAVIDFSENFGVIVGDVLIVEQDFPPRSGLGRRVARLAAGPDDGPDARESLFMFDGRFVDRFGTPFDVVEGGIAEKDD